ncbi:Uncharacterized protein SCF082_LOCUS30365, partial [Durusdinium trenchii]
MAPILALVYERGSSQPNAMVQVVQRQVGEAPRPGRAMVLNEGPLLFPSLATLRGRRLVVSFADSFFQSTALRLGRFDEAFEELELGESFLFDAIPAALDSFGPDGPILLAAASKARFIYTWERHMANGFDISLPGDSRSGILPSMTRLQEDEVALLLPSTGDPSAVSKLVLQWPCLLPEDTTGYRTAGCEAATTPILEQDCIVSCDVGFVVAGAAGAGAVCPRPPAPPVFQLQGCAALPCAAPMGIHNAGSPSCNGGAFVQNGGICQSACMPGYHPSVAELHCEVGRFQPPEFQCLAECCDSSANETCVATDPMDMPCAAPLGVGLSQDPSCREGYQIAPGSLCRSLCQEGYSPSVSELSCDVNGSGHLLPSTFQCLRARGNSSQGGTDKVWSSEIFLLNASLGLEIFPETLETPAAVLVELPGARSSLNVELMSGGLNTGLRHAVAAACRADVEQVAVLIPGSNITGRRLLEAFVSNVTILGLFMGEKNATEALLQLEELTAGGSAAQLFE